MKKITIIAAALLTIGAVGMLGGKSMAAEKNEQTQFIIRAGEQNSYEGPSQFFTGKVTVQPLFDAKHPDAPVTGAYVTFEPGARSNWHIHPTGQHLVVTDGIGRTGTIDGRIEEFKTGDVLWCPAGVKHWHGAAPDHSMTHFALTGTLPDGKNADWLEPVTDEQYHGNK